MTDKYNKEYQIQNVQSFEDLVCSPFHGNINAICWRRKLNGDFSEIVHKVEAIDNITILKPKDLMALKLSEQGQLARKILLNDFTYLKDYGAAPTLNVIKCYDRDDALPFFPTDVYSFHVDRSPVPTDTFLCTYYGACSEILPNSQARQKVTIPHIREELKKMYEVSEDEFEIFLTENFFDLHYEANLDAIPISCGLGNLWRLAVDCPQSEVLPCIHRAPVENYGQKRLLMIC